MLVIRSPLILAAPVAGLALAAVGWMALGGPARAVAPVDQLQQQLNALPAPRRAVAAAGGDAATAIARPLFTPDLGKVAIRLDGLSRSPGRVAALLSFNGGPSQWVTLGSTAQGATLTAVGDRRASVETAIGRRDVRLGETIGEPPAPAAGAPAPTAGDEPPPGTRLFPPASAPGGEP